MVNKECQLCEDRANMSSGRRSKAGASQVPQRTIRLKPFRTGGGLLPVAIVLIAQVFQERGRASGLMATETTDVAKSQDQ